MSFVERGTKRRAQKEQLDHYEKMFRTSKPLLDAMNQLNEAFNSGVYAERHRILSATKNLTYEES